MTDKPKKERKSLPKVQIDIVDDGKLSARQAAAQLGLSTVRIHRLISEGRIEAVRVGTSVRIDPVAITKFVQARDARKQERAAQKEAKMIAKRQAQADKLRARIAKLEASSK